MGGCSPDSITMMAQVTYLASLFSLYVSILLWRNNNNHKLLRGFDSYDAFSSSSTHLHCNRFRHRRYRRRRRRRRRRQRHHRGNDSIVTSSLFNYRPI